MPRWRLSPQESTDQIQRRRSNASEQHQDEDQVETAGDLDGDGVEWKAVFRERYKLRRCWLKGQCHVRTFEVGNAMKILCYHFIV